MPSMGTPHLALHLLHCESYLYILRHAFYILHFSTYFAWGSIHHIAHLGLHTHYYNRSTENRYCTALVHAS
jgi:hypothetical protein